MSQCVAVLQRTGHHRCFQQIFVLCRDVLQCNAVCCSAITSEDHFNRFFPFCRPPLPPYTIKYAQNFGFPVEALINSHIYTFFLSQVHKHTHAHKHTHTHTHTHARTRTRARTRTHTHTHTHIYTHAHTHIHTRTRTRTCTQVLLWVT